MAIQMRRGMFAALDPSKLLPGEWAVVLSGDANAADGKAVYVCFAAGSVKRMATIEDMAEQIIEANEDVIRELSSRLAGLADSVEAAESERAAAEEGRAGAESARASAEASRVAAEDGRAADEASRRSAESARASDEAARQSAEAARASAESSRAAAEADRASAEAARSGNEDDRVAAEAGRVTAEAGRVTAEQGRASAEATRSAAEAERVASFAEMEQRSKGWLRYYCAEGEFDPVSRRPSIGGNPDTATLYYVPAENPSGGNEWVEWMWDTTGGGRWEPLGTTEATVSPVTTAQINDIAAEQSVVSSNVLNGTGLTYLWAKAKAAFAAMTHSHSASDIDEGTLPAARGGTGVTTASAERNRLGLGDTTDALDIAHGGTGATTAAGARTALGLGDLPVYEVAAAWSGNEAAFIAKLPARPCVALSTDGYELWFDADASTDSY